ncbi:MAG: M24 family metallopeptidase [Chloroflexota bacterium]
MSAYLDRVTRLRAELDSAEVDGILISQPESRYYLSGYRGHDLPPRDSAGYLVITKQAALLFTDTRTSEQAALEASDYEVVTYSAGAKASDLLKERLGGLGARKLAFEAIHLPYQIYTRFNEALNGVAELVPTQDLVDRLRIVKDARELQMLQAAIDVLDECLAHVLTEIRPGRTEKEIAWEVERYLRTHGADGTSFNSIVASGTNASMPHAIPTDRPFQRGEPIKIDIGALKDGYCSDMTRTVCIGPAPERLKEIYSIVLEAQEIAERDMRPGMTGIQVDALSRAVIETAGYKEQFSHSTGHGIGLEVHEPPWVSPIRGETVLQPGMVFSVEPGIYLPGWGGVRIEDLVLMEESGARVLTGSPKKLELTEVSA